MWWIGSARSGHEFQVRDDILALGAYAWVAREFATVRPPTKRRHVAVPRPIQGLGRYVFVNVTDDGWHKLKEVKHLAGRMLPVSEATAGRSLIPFMDRVEADFMDRKTRFEAGERIAQYQPRDLLRIIEGPLADQLVRFRLVHEADAENADILEVEAPFMGGTVIARVDPLHVERVAE